MWSSCSVRSTDNAGPAGSIGVLHSFSRRNSGSFGIEGMNCAPLSLRPPHSSGTACATISEVRPEASGRFLASATEKPTDGPATMLSSFRPGSVHADRAMLENLPQFLATVSSSRSLYEAIRHPFGVESGGECGTTRTLDPVPSAPSPMFSNSIDFSFVLMLGRRRQTRRGRRSAARQKGFRQLRVEEVRIGMDWMLWLHCLGLCMLGTYRSFGCSLHSQTSLHCSPPCNTQLYCSTIIDGLCGLHNREGGCRAIEIVDVWHQSRKASDPTAQSCMVTFKPMHQCINVSRDQGLRYDAGFAVPVLMS